MRFSIDRAIQNFPAKKMDASSEIPILHLIVSRDINCSPPNSVPCTLGLRECLKRCVSKKDTVLDSALVPGCASSKQSGISVPHPMFREITFPRFEGKIPSIRSRSWDHNVRTHDLFLQSRFTFDRSRKQIPRCVLSFTILRYKVLPSANYSGKLFRQVLSPGHLITCFAKIFV